MLVFRAVAEALGNGLLGAFAVGAGSVAGAGGWLLIFWVAAGGDRYKDKAAYEEHSHSEDFRGLVKVMGEEGLLAMGLEITFLEPIAGFKGRL